MMCWGGGGLSGANAASVAEEEAAVKSGCSQHTGGSSLASEPPATGPNEEG